MLSATRLKSGGIDDLLSRRQRLSRLTPPEVGTFPLGGEIGRGSGGSEAAGGFVVEEMNSVDLSFG